MAKAINATMPFPLPVLIVAGQEHELAEPGAGILDPDMLDERAATGTRGERFGEGEVVLRLVEQDFFVQHRVRQRVHAPRDETRGEEVVLGAQSLEDLDEELVWEIQQPELGALRHDGGVRRGEKVEVEMR